MRTNPLTLLPAKARKALYVVYGVAGLVATGAMAYYGSLPDVAIPHWLTGSLAVLGAVAPAFAVLAGSNAADPDPFVPDEDGGGDGLAPGQDPTTAGLPAA